MTFAHVTGTTIDQIGALPELWHDGTRWWDLRPDGITTEELKGIGWYEVVRTTSPASTETTTHDSSVTLVDGVPTQTWTERPWTAEELAAQEAAVNDTEIGDKIETEDMPAMQAILDQTNANLRADPSQELKEIAKAVRRLDRKVQGLLDGTE